MDEGAACHVLHDGTETSEGEGEQLLITGRKQVKSLTNMNNNNRS